MNRRHFIKLAGSLPLVSRAAFAQTPAKVHRIVVMGPIGPVPASSPNGKLLLDALAQLGHVVGQDLAFEAPGQPLSGPEQLPQVMKTLTADKVDLIVAWGYPTILAAKLSGIASVAVFGAGDPVETGLVTSLAHPGGNVTGISDVATTLTTKRMGLLKELKPGLRSVAMIWNKDDLGMSLRYEASAKSAQAMGVAVQAVGVREPDDFNEAFSVMDRERPDAILMVSDSLTVLNRKRVFDYADARRLPAIYEYDTLVHEGGLMSYGPDLRESFERAAAKADQIFRGAKPGDLPFEQPTRYLLRDQSEDRKSDRPRHSTQPARTGRRSD